MDAVSNGILGEDAGGMTRERFEILVDLIQGWNEMACASSEYCPDDCKFHPQAMGEVLINLEELWKAAHASEHLLTRHHAYDP